LVGPQAWMNRHLSTRPGSNNQINCSNVNQTRIFVLCDVY
jgi:hypothetical protein